MRKLSIIVLVVVANKEKPTNQGPKPARELASQIFEILEILVWHLELGRGISLYPSQSPEGPSSVHASKVQKVCRPDTLTPKLQIAAIIMQIQGPVILYSPQSPKHRNRPRRSHRRRPTWFVPASVDAKVCVSASSW